VSVVVLLCDPKTPENVGGAIRAAHCFGADHVVWTGGRVLERPMSTATPIPKRAWRMNARERAEEWSPQFRRSAATPAQLVAGWRPFMQTVCVELAPGAVPLSELDHADDVVYVFGPEGGSVPRVAQQACHHTVAIPTVDCLNLAAAVNVVLYDRCLRRGEWPAAARQLNGVATASVAS
jgi:tRNA(Leu) C34 or U34 (ribose-2'-O)-methylase TrmL